ncbi:MAG TPA: MerR family transcriptional regulator [Prosthecobacter sp.]
MIPPEPSLNAEPSGNGSGYSLEILAQLSGVTRQTVLLYQENGLVQERASFDDDTVRTVRRIEYLRSTCEVNMNGLKMMMQLLSEVEDLRARLRAQR